MIKEVIFSLSIKLSNMKKFISFILVVSLVLTMVSVSFSDSVLDYLDELGWDILFWYASDDGISVDVIDTSFITITSPVLKDEFDEVISDYTVMYGEYPLVDVLDDPSLLEYSKEKAFENLEFGTDTTFTMDLATSTDQLDPDIIYYVVVVPRDDTGNLWEVSNELCFRLSDKVYWEWDECENVEMSSGSHAAWADMNLANITHTINWDRVTLRWIEVNGSDNVEIFERNDDEWTFHKLDTVSMSSESYTYNLDKYGEQIIKFIPDNGGVEKNYVFNALKTTDPVIPTKVTPVVVWPKENIIAILLGTILLYLVYRVVKRKA